MLGVAVFDTSGQTISFSPPNSPGLPAGNFLYSATVINMTGNPSSGTFSCPDAPGSVTNPGGSGAGVFNPSVAGVGPHQIHYSKPSGYDVSVTVYVVPSITFTPSILSFCEDGPDFSIDGYSGTPGGGTFTFSGTGVVGGVFHPHLASPGNYVVTATYELSGATNSTTATFNVKTAPELEFVGFNDNQCQDDPDYTIRVRNKTTLAFITSGTFTGKGITDNGDGTAVFSPYTAGLGYHAIRYTYVDVNSCIRIIDKVARVGTEIFIEDLPLTICMDEAPDIFTYSPINPGGDPLNRVTGPGVTDNLDGTASFDPSVAGVGIHVITYTFVDAIDAFLTCTNIITKKIQVYSVPSANFSGLNTDAEYCYGSGNVTLTGNYAPSGVFSGDGIINNGDGTATFVPSSLGVGNYSITYTYTNGSGCDNSMTKSVKILPIPTAYNVTGGGSYCETGPGAPVNLSDSDLDVDYYLYRNTLPLVPNVIVGGTDAGISFGNQIPAGVYTIRAVDAGGCTNTMNGSAVVSIIPKSAITSQPVNTTVCEEGSAAFTVEATGQNLHYAWFKNGAPVGIDNNILIINPVQLTDNGHVIYCRITSTCGLDLVTDNVTLTVNPINRIVDNPVSAVRCTGSGVNFSVIAQGLNRTYQWKKGGANVVNVGGKISGATSSVLTILNLNAADAGLYSCEVAGSCGLPVTSTQATLTVNDPIVITGQPSSLLACAGSNVAFSITATPAVGLTYQWYFNNGGGDVLVGTAPSLPIGPVDAGDEGNYYCRITNGCLETKISNIVTLDVPVTTSILTGPTGDAVCEGSALNMSVLATGENLTYQWFRDANPVPLADDAVIHNSSTANLSFTGLTTIYTGNYRVKVNGSCGEQISSPDAVLTVRERINISDQPDSRTICSGSDVTFSVGATGDDLSYQWQYNNADILLATDADYTITGATIADAGNYRCVISSVKCGIVISSSASLTINPLTVITTPPAALKNACIGTNVSFSVNATGVGLTYRWFKGATDLGITTSTLNLINVNAASAGSYTCQVTGTCGPVQISSPGILEVDLPSVIATHPVSASVCQGATSELNIVLSAGTNPIYQWYFDNDLDGIFIPVPTGTGQVYSIATFGAATAGDYYCEAKNGCGTVRSQTARLALVNVFSITTPLTAVSVCENGNTTLTVAADQPVSYRWFKNGALIAGQTSSSLILNNIPFADNGVVYRCELYNNCITRTTSATLSVSQPLTITQQPAGGTACPGSPYSLIVVSSGTTPAYQWYFDAAGGPVNFVSLPGETGAALSFTPYAAGNAGTYYCLVTNSCGPVQTSNAVLTTGTVTSVTNPLPLQLCTGEDAVFSVSATGDNLHYDWRKNYISLSDNGRIAGTKTNTLTINDIVSADEETYDVIVTGTCGLPVTSAGAYLEVTAPPVIITNPEPRTVCSGGNVSFSVTIAAVVSDPVPTYRWKQNDVPIDLVANPSAATPTLDITGAVAGGIYNCVITNSCGFITSTSAELIVEENVSILSHPVPIQTKCIGSNVTFITDITGPTDMTLQWYKNDGTPTGQLLVNGGNISGTDLPTLTINNLLATDAGSYFCRATSSCGVRTTDKGILIIQERIAVTQQPQSITICPAGTLTLNVIASGTITGYQWRFFDGTVTTDVGTNDPVYSISPFDGALHAGTYTVEMTNICETVVSSPAIISSGVPTNATISADIIRCEGSNASFIVTATGSNLVYHWYHGGNLLSDDARVGGTSTNTLTISGVIPGDNGTYQCEVTGSCGFDNDNAAVLTVQKNIYLDVQPASTSALIGTTASFTVVAGGNITGYQWYKGSVALTDVAGETSGTNTATLNIINAQPVTDEGDYSCVIVGPCGNRTSNSATLTVIPASVITIQPVTPLILCEGATISIFVTTSGSGHTYQWKLDDTPLVSGGRITGATTSSLTISAAIASDAGAYTCVIDGIEISSASIVIVNPLTAITVHPLGGTKCAGDIHTFSVSATGAGLSYQWYKNDLLTPIAGALSSEYKIDPVSALDNGTYFCVVTGICGPKTSNPATLTVNSPVSIIDQPSPPLPICEGSSTAFTFNVTGTGLVYQWKKNGQPVTESNVSGINNPTLLISNSVLANAGVYSCTVSGACSAPITSDNVTVIVNPVTAITTHPVSRITCEGDVVTFAVTAVGSSLSYDWRFNGASLGLPLPGTPTLTITGLVKATHEGIYTCFVSGACGNVTSDPAVLTINRATTIGAPVITANPICETASTKITIIATGDGLTYLWKKNGVNITSPNITGINTNELVISNALPGDGGGYTCTVTGLCGSPLTSTSAVVTVNPSTLINSQPSGSVKCAGDEVIMGITASGNITSYQWLKGGVAITDGPQPSGAVVSGAGSAQIKITNLTTNEADSYTVAITGICGNLTSEQAVLTVNVPVSIPAGGHPAALTRVCQGSSTSLDVSVSGTVLSYRWKKNGTFIYDSGSFSGTTTSKLIISGAKITDAGIFSCEISSTCNTISTTSAELIVDPVTTITLQPSNATLCAGENVQFLVNATGGLPLSYEWRFNNVAIPGATTNNLIINGINTLNAGGYTCYIMSASGCGAATSTPATLTVNPGASVVTQPINTSVCEGSTAIISLTAAGTAPVTYRWKYNNNYITEGGRYTGVSTNELRISGSTDSDEGIYKCEIISPCGTVESNSVTLTVDMATSIAVQPLNQSVVLGTSAVFSVSANGVITGYQWTKNGSPLTDDLRITGSTSAILRIANIAVADAGFYRCIVTGKCGTLSSNPGSLTVNVPVAIIDPPDVQDACTGGSASFNVVATGSIVSYQWMFNGGPLSDGTGIAGTNTPNLVISSVTTANKGNYACVVTGTFNTANSASAELTVTEPADIVTQPVTQSLCVNDWLILEVAANGDNLSYTWEKDGFPLSADANTSGINMSLLVITDVDVSRAGSYRCRVSNACNTELSNAAVITINPAMNLVTPPSNDIKCEGQNSTFSVIATGVNIRYQWYKGGSQLINSGRISGATTANLTISNVQLTDQDSYSCTIEDNCNTINSPAVTLTVKEKVVISQQPQNMTVCEGQNAFFEVRARGFNLTYQWRKDGSNIDDDGNISGTKTSVLVINNVVYADRGVYTCQVTGDCNSILTNPGTLSVNLLPAAAGTVSGSTTICQGSTRVFYVVPQIANATSYIWTLPYGAVIVSGAGTRSIEVDYPVGSISGVVSVHGTNGCTNGSESPVLDVEVNPLPLAFAGPDQVICADATAFVADATGYVPGSGIWTKISGQGTISNANLPNSTITGLSQGDNIFRWTVTVDGCTSWDEVKLTNKKVFVDAGTDQTICSMSSVLQANTPTIGSGEWSIVSGGALFSNKADPASEIVNLSRGFNVFRWTINNGGCYSHDDVGVRNDLPTNANAGRDTIIITDTYTLGGNIPVIGTGEWSLISGSAVLTNTLQNNASVSGLGIGENIFRWRISNNLCYSQDEVKVVNYTPIVTDAGINQILCTDKTILSGTRPMYGTGQWSVVAGSGSFVDPGSFDTDVINIGKGQNIYRWTIYEYMTTFDDVIITNNSPTRSNAGIDQRICSTDALLNANDPLVGTGVWTIIGGSGNIVNPTDFRSAVTNLGSGLNTLRWTITNGACTSYDEVSIINDQPTYADAGADQIICADSVSLYPNTPTIGLGEWSVVQGSAFFKGNKAYNLSRGENHLRWSITNNGCTNSDIVIFTSNKPTTSLTGVDKSVCTNSINLPGNIPTFGTGVWAVLSGSGIIENPNNATSLVTNMASGQNRFRWTITYNGCVSFSEVNINYNYVQADAGIDQTLCQTNASLSANDAGIGKGQWSIVGGSGSADFANPDQSNTEVINLDRGNNVLRWTIINAGCVSTDEVLVVNNMPSDAYAGSDRIICGEDIQLNANTPLIGTGEWSLLSGAANIADPASSYTRISNMSIGRNIMRWTITHENCISSDEVVITNNQPSNIEAGPNQYICADSAQLYATAPVSGYGRWSILKGSATFEDNSIYNSSVFNLEKGENKLIWTVTSAGCSNYDSVIVVNNLPTSPNAGPDQDLCADNVLMAANIPLIGAGKWSIVSGSAIFSNTGLPGTNVTKLSNGPNVLRWTISNGSCTLYDEVTIKNSLPTAAYAGEDRAICNTEANLLATAPVSGTGSWSVVSGYGVFTDANAFDAQITNLGFGSNTLRWTTTNGRCRTSDDVIITNNLSDVYAGPDQIVYNPTVRLIGNKPSRGIGNWIVTAGNGNIGTPGNFETYISNLGEGANTFTWTIINDGCIASDNVVVTHRKLPTVDFDPMPGGGCVPATISFINTSIGGAPYTWDFGDGTTSTSTNSSHTYTVPGNYKVKLKATGPDGIFVYRDTTIVVREIPVASFNVTPEKAYIPGNAVSFHNLTENIDSLMWEFGDGNTSTELNPLYKYSQEGIYDVTLHVWSGYQCYDSLVVNDAVTVELAGIIICPNAFTPNPGGSSGGSYDENDFSNDVFHCYIEGAVTYHMEVYNRIGVRIFETNDINIGWDGYFKGDLVEQGAYVFRAWGKFNNGETFNYFGNIVVIY
ncbi:MAG TPA: immunoglobulin domain-containing protein [Bacteroidales bacterium]|nr:immunoglobulin domain-containing protein [Bacteroidales bacterium]